MKHLKIIIGLLIMLPICLFSQNNRYPAMKVIEKDTVIVFHVKQAKELIKVNEQKKECQELLSLSEKQLTEKDKVIDLQQKQIKNHSLITNNQDTIIARLNDNLAIQEEKNKLTLREVKRQRNHKVISLIGLVCVAIVGIIL